ncbi:uncharacterized protein LOC109826811 [Asparagus officinalis]|uniref:uncharacterized protein LOC109826811 n=1 Tax=Asparagus officinalis TaxID=4686 RepID=UPI00098E5096|nr:uncharacterized protein LOC109826811 [Asparagus officinalis]
MEPSGPGFGSKSGSTNKEDKWSLPFCTIVAVDTSESISYRACSICERTLPEDPSSFCSFCSNNSSANPGCKRVYRILVNPIHDRVTRVLFGCSADEFFHFCRLHPFAAEKAAEVLEGEMCRLTLSKPKSTNAQHLRAASVVPLHTGFRPVIATLKQMYGIETCSSGMKKEK